MIMLRMSSSLFHSRDGEKRAVGKMVPRRPRSGTPALLASGTIIRSSICGIDGQPRDDSDSKMRLLLAIIVIIYLVGVGVVLSPIIRSTWNTEPASVLADRIVQALPDALTWPMKAVRAFAGS
jgi:hypothetical protein